MARAMRAVDARAPVRRVAAVLLPVVLLLALVVFITHRANIKRLLAGTEPKSEPESESEPRDAIEVNAQPEPEFSAVAGDPLAIETAAADTATADALPPLHLLIAAPRGF